MNLEKAPTTPALTSESFELAQRMAKAIATSSLVPKDYQNNIPNCMVAMEYANRIGMSVLAVMQNLHIIHGRPAPSSTFLIGALNACGRFSPINYRMTGTENTDSCGCIAYAYDKNGNLMEGPEVTMAMAKAEGWATKPGSKWKTMPGLMLRYRSAAFFARLFAPEVVLGMHTAEEVSDFGEVKQKPKELPKSDFTFEDDVQEVE